MYIDFQLDKRYSEIDSSKLFMWINEYRNLDTIIKEIRENKYENQLADIYIRELLESDKKYD